MNEARRDFLRRSGLPDDVNRIFGAEGSYTCPRTVPGNRLVRVRGITFGCPETLVLHANRMDFGGGCRPAVRLHIKRGAWHHSENFGADPIPDFRLTPAPAAAFREELSEAGLPDEPARILGAPAAYRLHGSWNQGEIVSLFIHPHELSPAHPFVQIRIALDGGRIDECSCVLDGRGWRLNDRNEVWGPESIEFRLL